ncbi:MAG TPA: molybdopterin-dependent oxidoreductase [Vicinamibacterales bacterium]|nr:molybdopterin-dependent oxidoreductase [Vicinamibacterales bacterium]
MDRRSFIKLTAISGTSAALASCGSPENEIIRFVPDEDIMPGIATMKPSVCTLCASGCGLTVRMMMADADVVRNGQAGLVRIHAAKKLEGRAEHPVNHGGLCARGQAAIQVTYHPDRITQPLRRSGDRGQGKYDAISWDDAIAELVTRMDMLASSGNQKSLAFMGRGRRDHRAALVDRFLAAYGAPGAVTYELFNDHVLRRANALSFGREQLPTFDLPNTRYVLSFGADFLGTWNSPTSQGYGYGMMRQGRPGIRGMLVQVESRMSQTGANADQWIPVKPGTEGVLALGLANVIMMAKLRPASGGGRAGSLIAGWSSGLSEFAPEQVEQITGVAASRIERLARELAEISPSLAIVGGSPLAHTNALFNALAVNALNALLGNVDRPGGVFFTPQINLAAAAKGLAGRATAAPALDRFTAGIADGSGIPQVLLLDGANPVFTSPKGWRVREALEKIPYIASFGSFLDETAALSDLILPDHSFLETFSEALPESGSMTAVASVAPAAMMPLYQTRATPDVLLDVGRKLAKPLNLPWENFEALLTEAFSALPTTSTFDTWTDAQEKGGWWGKLPAALTTSAAASTQGKPLAFSEPQFDGDAAQYPLHFLPYASSAFLDGSLAHLPWLQEMPDPLTSAMWSSWIEINTATAAKLGIRDGDIVEVASAHGTLRTAAILSPGIAPDVVAMPVGQGHQRFTRYATGRGENPIELLAPLTEPETGSLAWAATRVRITRVGDPDGRLILFAGGSREEQDKGR